MKWFSIMIKFYNEQEFRTLLIQAKSFDKAINKLRNEHGPTFKVISYIVGGGK